MIAQLRIQPFTLSSARKEHANRYPQPIHPPHWIFLNSLLPGTGLLLKADG
jgi:hypothetical protein